MSFNIESAISLIQTVATEQKYIVEEMSDTNFLVWLGKHHGVDFELSVNSSDYIQCNQWDEESETYGRAIYSLRSQSDVVHFCSTLISSALIRAKRKI